MIYLYNLKSTFRINFEFPPTGGIVTDGSFKTVRLLRYITKMDYVLMGNHLHYYYFFPSYLMGEIFYVYVNLIILFDIFYLHSRMWDHFDDIGILFPGWRSYWNQNHGVWILQKLLELFGLMCDYGKCTWYSMAIY